MDDRRFDQLARALGGVSTRRGALAALAGIAAGLGAAGKDAEAKKGRRKCDPACPAGQTCRQGACGCDNGGTVCGASCCTDGQTCQSGTCADPLPQCLAFGASCKNAGVPCCDGTVCASGQGGKGDIACYRPAGAACASTAECVYDSRCIDGACIANDHPNGGASGPCSATATAGGETAVAGGFRVHTFKAPGNHALTFAGACSKVEYLVVGGGGGSGSGAQNGTPTLRWGGGGGGGGEVLTGSLAVPAGPLAVLVGGGGAAAGLQDGTAGEASQAGSITARGGSGGLKYADPAGGAGGASGAVIDGGFGADATVASSYYGGGGGGGGASALGASAVGGAGGAGGAGRSVDVPGVAPQTYGTGGAGGGTTGGDGENGGANTGDGGSGKVSNVGGQGGSGIVIVWYPIA